jgi:hypothetical protein
LLSSPPLSIIIIIIEVLKHNCYLLAHDWDFLERFGRYMTMVQWP